MDELIYEKAGWEHFVGAERNDYNSWHPVATSDPTPLDGPPRRPPVDEAEIDLTALVPGEAYPGNPSQGAVYSIDTQGTVRDEQGSLVQPNDALRLLMDQHGRAGRFRVTNAKGYVIQTDRAQTGWQTIFLGRLDKPLEIAGTALPPSLKTNYKPGDPYPLERAKGKLFSVLQRDARLIAVKEKGHIRFVVPGEALSDERKRDALRQIQRFLSDAYARGQRMSKITVTDEGQVVFTHNGQAWFVGHAPEGVSRV